ncbi:DNA (cytosine-5)-methyltransferase CMT2-like isoform X1 [Salvia splendens]|uniref:DNA (cytosine-5)-methyltransferase CMT2-like isoform X1 n=1 Tax=Salvia splendens TaxID=180675 RepID=UPI001C278E8E|nr:DNA (cytosine-5)-methyltransferase CMT2-like isoform X1 [Salvia splendens]
MKKLPQQLPSRKSSRFSSSPAAAAASSTRTRNKPEPRPDDAWALSLPLRDNSLRRSTRFASKTPPPQSRTSPTFPPSSSAPALTLTDGENVVLSERCLRSRTVLMKRVVSERRGRGRGRGKAAAEIEMLALTPVSRNAEQSVELLSKERCSSEGVISEKRLRSRIVQFKGIVAEDAARKRDRNGSVVRSRSIQLKQNVAEDALGKADQKGGGGNEESSVRSGKKKRNEKGVLCCFVGEPIPEEDAWRRWQWRYDLKSRGKGKNWKINTDDDNDEIILNVESHYAQAKVGNSVLNIGDCVFVKGEGSKKHIGRILEFFKTTAGEDYFRVQWFFRAEDTVLKNAASSHDKRRIFYSTLMNDNVLDCIISKVNIVKVPSMQCLKRNPVPSAAFYYDMEYSVNYSTFRSLVTETSTGTEPFLSNSKPPEEEPVTLTPLALLPEYESPEQELALLDLYAGCGGMSTGLCLGAKLSSVNVKTRWAVDYNSAACESLKLNHPETNVRNEAAEDFLELLKQWESLCKMYVCDIERALKCEIEELPEAKEACLSSSDTEESSDEYEVSHLVDICYGDPNESGKCGLLFKVRWKGYGPDDDTWEAAEGLSNCHERIEDFVRRGFKSKILPLPGDVGVICGGPPCQGVSGYNRHRNYKSPLEDEKNRQIVVFMDIVEFLKPKYCLMENVVDIIRFDKGSLGRYALSRLVLMKYQARLGTIASGCYGLPQFRLRVFIWGAHPSQVLPQFPLPTHDVVARYWAPIEFERNIVAYDEGQPHALRPAIVLGDAISDLPPVTNDESREEMAYEKPPESEFQKRIRMSKDETTTGKISAGSHGILYDHRPMKLDCSDYMRVCQVPHRKGANFRDLAGVVVGEDKVVRRDPTREPVVLPTGKLLVPDCVLTYELGKSKRPYGRLWWDETVSTVVTFPHIRAQSILHPDQDRRLTIRECARLQGFPDYYRFCGTVKERYCQIGNAVSMPVSRALGYALGVAHRKVAGDEPLMTLPPDFSSMLPSST